MHTAIHLVDFFTRIDQLYDSELIKEAYVDYVSTVFEGYRIWKTPVDVGQGVNRDFSDYLLAEGLITADDEVVQDELVCIVGASGSLGPEMAEWLEGPRHAVQTRLEELRAASDPDSEAFVVGQKAFRESLWAAARDSRQIVGLMVSPVFEFAPMSMSVAVERICRGLHPDACSFRFGPLKNVFLFKLGDEDVLRHLVHDALLFSGTLAFSGAVVRFGEDTLSPGTFCRLLQQGVMDAERLYKLPGFTDHHSIVYAEDWIPQPSDDDDDGTDHCYAPLRNPDGPLSAGAARRLEDEGTT